jgi:uncharacterized membrane protein YccC
LSIVLLSIIAACLLFGAAAVLSRIAVLAGMVLVAIAGVLALYPLTQALLWAAGDKVIAMAVVIVAFTLFCVFYFGRRDPTGHRPIQEPGRGSSTVAAEGWSQEEQLRLAEGSTLADIKARSERP